MKKAEFFDKVYGCFYGKRLGGAAGAPFEGVKRIIDVKDYKRYLSVASNTTIIPAITANEGQTLGDIQTQLPTGWVFDDPITTTVGTAGTKTFRVTLPKTDDRHEVTATVVVTE